MTIELVLLTTITSFPMPSWIKTGCLNTCQGRKHSPTHSGTSGADIFTYTLRHTSAQSLSHPSLIFSRSPSLNHSFIRPFA